MEFSPVAEAPRRIAGLDALERPLPALMMTDSPDVGPKVHAWPGTFFYGLSYLLAVGIGGASVVGAISAVVQGWDPAFYALPVIGGVWSALQWRLAREVERFTRWGWYGAMGGLGFAAAAKLWALALGQPGAALGGLLVDAFLLRYFWKRRAQFDIDTSF